MLSISYDTLQYNLFILLGTHYIQNVSVAPGVVSGEVKVSCNFVNGTELMGYLAIANGNDEIGYMVAERRSQEGNQVDRISNLVSGEYNVSIFTVNQTGLPETLSANFPRNVSIMKKELQSTDTTVARGEQNVNITLVETNASKTEEVCYNCTFRDNDIDSTCIAVAHPCGISSLYPGLSNISVTKFLRAGNNAVGCIDLSQCEIHYVAVLYFDGQKGMVEGSPLVKMNLNIGIQNLLPAVYV